MSGSPAEDRALLERLRGGDSAAFEALYLRHRDRLYRHALVHAGGRAAVAEEVVQDVFLSLFEGQAAPRQEVAPYLLAAARNRALNAWARREGRADRAPAAELDLLVARGDDVTDPVEAARRREEGRLLARALLDLPPEQREVVLLRSFEGLPWKEVAALTGVPLATASTRYRAALTALRGACRSLTHA